MTLAEVVRKNRLEWTLDRHGLESSAAASHVLHDVEADPDFTLRDRVEALATAIEHEHPVITYEDGTIRSGWCPEVEIARRLREVLK